MFTRIVVGTDGSETAGEAVRQAVDLAKLTGAELSIVSAYSPVSERRVRDTQDAAQRIAELSEARRILLHG